MKIIDAVAPQSPAQKRRGVNISKVYDYLTKHGPWHQYGTGLAYKLGISYDELREVLNIVRTPAWMDEYGWTIPFVGQGGPAGRPYAVVETKEGAEVVLVPGQKSRAGDLLSALRNFAAQADYGQVLLDPTTTEGRWNTLAVAQAHAMVALADSMGVNGTG